MIARPITFWDQSTCNKLTCFWLVGFFLAHRKKTLRLHSSLSGLASGVRFSRSVSFIPRYRMAIVLSLLAVTARASFATSTSLSFPASDLDASVIPSSKAEQNKWG